MRLPRCCNLALPSPSRLLAYLEGFLFVPDRDRKHKSCLRRLPLPARQRRLGVHRPALNVDLEVEVAANADRVAGLPHRADALAGEDPIAAMKRGRTGHVGVEVRALLAFAMDQQVMAVKHRVVAGSQHLAVSYRDEGRAAGGDDVEAFVPAAAAARSTELADVAAGAVRPLDGEDVVVVGEAAVRGDTGFGGRGKGREE